MKRNTFVALLVLCLVLVGCTAGPNSLVNTTSESGDIAGFWLGLWHGMIAPITWFISMLSPNMLFYEVHINGGWYNLGFMLGFGALGSGASSVSSSKK